MHPNYPIHPDNEDADCYYESARRRDLPHQKVIERERSKTIMRMEYKHTSSSTVLRQHATKYHNSWIHQLHCYESMDNTTDNVGTAVCPAQHER